MSTSDLPLAPVAAKTIADAGITTAIKRLFTTREGMNEQLLDVATHEGLVTLTGSTDNLVARQRAEKIALAVRGVRGVPSKVIVQISDLPDADLQRNVGRARQQRPPSRHQSPKPLEPLGHALR